MFSQLESVDRAVTPLSPLSCNVEKFPSPRHFMSICCKIVLIDRFCQNEMIYCHHWKIVTIIKTVMGNGMALDLCQPCTVPSLHTVCMSAWEWPNLQYFPVGAAPQMNHHTAIRSHLLPSSRLSSLSHFSDNISYSLVLRGYISSLTLGLCSSDRCTLFSSPRVGAQNSGLTNQAYPFPRLPLVRYGHVTPVGPMRVNSRPWATDYEKELSLPAEFVI